MLDKFLDFMDKGGPVLWLLLTMSIVTLTLIIERTWFWLTTNSRKQLARSLRVEQLLRRGDVEAAKRLVEDDTSVYGSVARMLLDEGYTPETALAAVEMQRPRIDRYMGVLSTMITAAPLVGLLGTVTGMIATFRFLSEQISSTNPNSVGSGLAEALLNTAGGLVIAVVAIFPYNIFRVQVDRTLGRLESLMAAASRSVKADPKKEAEKEPDFVSLRS